MRFLTCVTCLSLAVHPLGSLSPGSNQAQNALFGRTLAPRRVPVAPASPRLFPLQKSGAHLLSREFVLHEPPTRESHAPKIVECTDGRLTAAWFGGTREGATDVAIWLSVREKSGWTAPRQAANGRLDESHQYPCWNPVLFRAKDGLLYLFYKVGPSPETWWGVMKRSSDDGKTWSDPEQLPEGFIGPVKNKPLELADGTILCPSSVEKGGTWRIHLEAMSDEGRTWKKIPIGGQEGFGLIQPSILTYPDGKLQVLCRSRQDAIVSAWSEDGGKTWSGCEKTDLPNPNSGIDAATLRSGLQVLVFNPTVRGETWSEGRNKLSVSVSSDGKMWRDVYSLEDERTGEFSYPAIIQTADGLIHIVYTWKRENIRHVVLEIAAPGEPSPRH
jgi:alpha-L-fucosidase